MAHELYAIEKSSNRLLVWTNVASIAYSDETLYEGEVFRHEFSLAMAGSNKAYLFKDTANTLKSSPDSVLGTDPRKKAIKRSIITITAGGVSFKVVRDRLRGGCLTNINPETNTASGTTYYARLRSGSLLAFGAVTGIAYSNESIFDGDTHSNEFDLTNAGVGDGFLEDSAGSDAVPDSISKTAPGHTEKDRSIITITVTHGATPASMDLRVFRDELAGMGIMNTNPDA